MVVCVCARVFLYLSMILWLSVNVCCVFVFVCSLHDTIVRAIFRMCFTWVIMLDIYLYVKSNLYIMYYMCTLPLYKYKINTVFMCRDAGFSHVLWAPSYLRLMCVSHTSPQEYVDTGFCVCECVMTLMLLIDTSVSYLARLTGVNGESNDMHRNLFSMAIFFMCH